MLKHVFLPFYLFVSFGLAAGEFSSESSEASAYLQQFTGRWSGTATLQAARPDGSSLKLQATGFQKCVPAAKEMAIQCKAKFTTEGESKLVLEESIQGVYDPNSGGITWTVFTPGIPELAEIGLVASLSTLTGNFVEKDELALSRLIPSPDATLIEEGTWSFGYSRRGTPKTLRLDSATRIKNGPVIATITVELERKFPFVLFYHFD